MFKDCSKKDGEENAENTTTGPKDKRMDQTKDKGERMVRQKWKWAGHLMRVDDNRWTKKTTEWRPRITKRNPEDQKQDGKMTPRNWQVPSG